MNLLKKVFVRSENDLPKGDGWYFVKIKGLPIGEIALDIDFFSLRPNAGYKEDWLNKIDFYLIEIETEDIQTPIEDGLYATGRFTQDECCVLAEGLMSYIGESVSTKEINDTK